jgi:hypothetical protein
MRAAVGTVVLGLIRGGGTMRGTAARATGAGAIASTTLRAGLREVMECALTRVDCKEAEAAKQAFLQSGPGAAARQEGKGGGGRSRQRAAAAPPPAAARVVAPCISRLLRAVALADVEVAAVDPDGEEDQAHGGRKKKQQQQKQKKQQKGKGGGRESSSSSSSRSSGAAEEPAPAPPPHPPAPSAGAMANSSARLSRLVSLAKHRSRVEREMIASWLATTCKPPCSAAPAAAAAERRKKGGGGGGGHSSAAAAAAAAAPVSAVRVLLLAVRGRWARCRGLVPELLATGVLKEGVGMRKEFRRVVKSAAMAQLAHGQSRHYGAWFGRRSEVLAREAHVTEAALKLVLRSLPKLQQEQALADAQKARALGGRTDGSSGRNSRPPGPPHGGPGGGSGQQQQQRQMQEVVPTKMRGVVAGVVVPLLCWHEDDARRALVAQVQDAVDHPFGKRASSTADGRVSGKGRPPGPPGPPGPTKGIPGPPGAPPQAPGIGAKTAADTTAARTEMLWAGLRLLMPLIRALCTAPEDGLRVRAALVQAGTGGRLGPELEQALESSDQRRRQERELEWADEETRLGLAPAQLEADKGKGKGKGPGPPRGAPKSRAKSPVPPGPPPPPSKPPKITPELSTKTPAEAEAAAAAASDSASVAEAGGSLGMLGLEEADAGGEDTFALEGEGAAAGDQAAAPPRNGIDESVAPAEGGGGGGGGGAAAEAERPGGVVVVVDVEDVEAPEEDAPEEPEGPVLLPADAPLEQKLVAYYAQYNPTKSNIADHAHHVAHRIAQGAHSERKLNMALHKKYGVDLSAVVDPALATGNKAKGEAKGGGEGEGEAGHQSNPGPSQNQAAAVGLFTKSKLGQVTKRPIAFGM